MPIVEGKAQFSQVYEELGAIVPDVLTDIETETCWIEEIFITGNGSSDVTILVQDRQSTPRPLFNNETLSQSAGTKSNIGYVGRRLRMSGGISIQASAANAAIYRIRYWK